jgi:hypothetical protein
MKVETRTGSATDPHGGPVTDGVIIAHLCNHIGAWGKGFVLAIDDLSPAPKVAYQHYAKTHKKQLALGVTQFIEVEPHLFVANMIAQNGIDTSQGSCLVDYGALNKCLENVFLRAVLLRCNVHIPAGMGSGLAGGSKQMITDLITANASSKSIADTEKVVGFVPTVTLWEFTDVTAKSYVAGVATTIDPGRGLDLDLDDL